MMSKTGKHVILTVVLVLVMLLALLAVWVFLLNPYLKGLEFSHDSDEPIVPELAQESEYIDYDSESGELYYNNEVILIVSEGASVESVRTLASEQHADLDESLSELGVYRLVYRGQMDRDELDKTLRRLKKDYDFIDDAYINALIELESDDTEEIARRAPVIPTDPWDGALWSMEVPRDANWGVEAIRAPAAWAYLDEMQPVRLGLIDTVPDTGHEDLTIWRGYRLFRDASTGTYDINKYSIAAGDHGSHVAGIIGADWNWVGTTGVSGGLGELYYSSYYVENSGSLYSNYATAFDYVQAITKLVESDVRAINISQNTSRLIGFAASHGNAQAQQHLQRQAALAQTALARLVQTREPEGAPDFLLCIAAGNSNNTRYYPDASQPYGYRENMTFWEFIKSAFVTVGEIGGSEAKYNNFLNLIDDETVASRIVVVGSVGIDAARSSGSQSRYSYSYFSNIGDRVDIVAPGEDIYSSIVGGYKYMSGTSMATPHVTGVAGLILAANPELTGPEVKSILLSSTSGRYYYQGGHSGMVNAELAVLNALETRTKPVQRVLRLAGSAGLDVCFVVDTTGSMGDDIDNTKENMADILASLSEKSADYRVALIDYRDFSERTGRSFDYPARLRLDFSSDEAEIVQAINDLDLGNGGDNEETVFSGIIAAVGLDWRPTARKVVIVMGDAAPLDPEPYTGYTFSSVLTALYNADIGVDIEHSDARVLGDPSDSLISVYSIGTDASDSASEFFAELSEITGGVYSGVDDASEVADAVIESIGQIELAEPTQTVSLEFGAEMADEIIDLYSEDGEYLFTAALDEAGRVTLEEMPLESYDWACPALLASGSLEVEEGDRSPLVTTGSNSLWFRPTLLLWKEHSHLIVFGCLLAVAFSVTVSAATAGVAGAVRRKKAAKQP